MASARVHDHVLDLLARPADQLAVMVGDDANILAGLSVTYSSLWRSIGTTAGQSTFAAARVYQATHGRYELIEALGRAWAGRRKGATPYVDAPIPAGVEVFIDVGITGGFLENRLRNGGWRIRVNADIGFPGKPKIYTPFGDLSVSQDLVLTRDDLSSWEDRREHVFADIRAVLSQKRVVAILSAAELERLEEVHERIFRMDSKRGHRPVLVIVGGDQTAARVWDDRDYNTVSIPGWSDVPHLFARSAIMATNTVSRNAPSEAGDDGPYRFLDYYTEGDRSRFFGRQPQIDSLHRHILDRRASLILGPSGVGKTSLVLAGVVPRLREEGVAVGVARPFEDPLGQLKQAALAAVGRALKDADGTPMASVLELVTSLDRPLALILDQLEELFTKTSAAARSDFATGISAIMGERYPGLHMVFVMRDDFMHRLLAYEPELTHLVDGRYAVPFFDREAARAAIVGSAARSAWEIAGEVVDAILDDLHQPEGIGPSQLSIVCTGLYERSSAGAAVDIALYSGAGGASGILDAYLEDMLADLGTGSATAREILKEMVTISRTKSTATRADLERVFAAAGNGADREDLLDELVHRRVIRRIEDDDTTTTRYELAHDLIADRVYEWLTDEEEAAKYARHLLRTAASDWRLRAVVPESGAWNTILNVPPEDLTAAGDASFMLIAALHHDESEQTVSRCLNATRPLTDPWNELAAAWDRLSLTAQLGAVRLSADAEGPSTEKILALAEAAPNEALRRSGQRARRVRAGGPRHVLNEAQWVRVEGGRFIRGTDHPDFATKYASPPHEVWVSTFYIQTFPVTCAEYAVYVDETGHPPPPYWHGARPDPRREDHPVVEVTWTDALSYCEWYGAHFGLPTRLPTEAEWEKAATWHVELQKKTLWSWGDTFRVDCANARESRLGTTTPIGFFSPQGDSPYGVAEMCGNTFDWVHDWWVDQYDTSDVVDPVGPATGVDRVARGGSWAGSSIDNSGCSHGYKLPPSQSNEYVGFRMAYTPPPIEAQ